MDYCSECRRHLNGALVCPGCGAYAPDIAPPGIGTSRAPGAATASWFETPAAPEGTGEPEPASPGVPADVEDAPPVREGRAARRHRRAQWKRNRRRAVVATAVALVGGGLTVSSMNRHTADPAQAATAPDDHGMGGTPRHQAPEHAPGPSASSTTRPTPAARTPVSTDTVRQAVATRPRPAPPQARPASTTPATPTAPATPSTPAPRSTPPAPPAHTGTPTPPATPAPTTGTQDPGTDPTRTQLCVLVLCLG
ncbi:hypothetical protein ABZX64_22210 [Streptomyces misionensis]|uniref:SCO2400 family protein n=1 Tax=Streptomyces misionensis TaxID=67331 RepID=UPI0033ABCFF8